MSQSQRPNYYATSDEDGDSRKPSGKASRRPNESREARNREQGAYPLTSIVNKATAPDSSNPSSRNSSVASYRRNNQTTVSGYDSPEWRGRLEQEEKDYVLQMKYARLIATRTYALGDVADLLIKSDTTSMLKGLLMREIGKPPEGTGFGDLWIASTVGGRIRERLRKVTTVQRFEALAKDRGKKGLFDRAKEDAKTSTTWMFPQSVEAVSGMYVEWSDAGGLCQVSPYMLIR